MAGQGQVERLIILAPGAGYTSPPTVSLDAPPAGGTLATAVATVIGGGVAGLQLTNPGAGYLTAPGVSVSGGGGSGAAGRALLAAPSYATVADFREYLPDVTQAIASDAMIQRVLDRATGICNDASVGLGFAFGGYLIESRPVLSTHSPYLLLPPHQLGSVTSVSLYGTRLAAGLDYTLVPESNGLYESLYRTTTQAGPGWWPPPARDSWGWMGYYYDVVAAWGFGPPPESVVEVCLEIAVNIYQSRKAGRFTNVVGASDGGAVGYEGALTPQQKAVLAGVRALYQREAQAV